MSGRGKKKQVVEGETRRSPRLQAKQLINDVPPKDSFTGAPVTPGAKVFAWERTPCPVLAKSIFLEHVSSLPPKRLEEAGNVGKPWPERPANELGESEDDSTSNAQTVINSILESLCTATTPVHRSVMNVPVGGCEDTLPSETFNVTVVPASASFFATTEQVASHFCEQRPQGTANPNSTTVETQSFGLTEIVSMCVDEDSGTDEAESAPLVTISGTLYRVTEKLAPIITSIITHHGDIAANHHMKTPEGRSLALENLAEFIQKFQTKKFNALSELEIQNALDLVCDFSDAGLYVCWLKLRLVDILEAKKLIKQSSNFREKKYKIDQVISEKKIKLQELQQQLNLAHKELELEQAKAENLKSTISNAKAKVKYFLDHLPFDGLF